MLASVCWSPQCVAGCCSALQCVAVFVSCVRTQIEILASQLAAKKVVCRDNRADFRECLPVSAVPRRVLQCVAVCCSVLQCLSAVL